MENLVDLYKWFDKNRDTIINNHLNECVLLKDNAVIGYYPDTEAALSNAQKNGFVMGEFLIQDCITNEEEMVFSFRIPPAETHIDFTQSPVPSP